MKVILASASPRRKELLKRIFSEFEIKITDIDESIPEGIENANAPEYLAVKKAKAIIPNRDDELIIAADTVVLLEGEILGKPEDDVDAERMLKNLSGKTHKVVTGCCLVMGNKISSFSVESEVTFYPLSDDEIANYVRKGLSKGKAGAYGIQDEGGLFVEKISGDYYNIVGLPIAKLYQEIKNL